MLAQFEFVFVLGVYNVNVGFSMCCKNTMSFSSSRINSTGRMKAKYIIIVYKTILCLHIHHFGYLNLCEYAPRYERWMDLDKQTDEIEKPN